MVRGALVAQEPVSLHCFDCDTVYCDTIFEGNTVSQWYAPRSHEPTACILSQSCRENYTGVWTAPRSLRCGIYRHVDSPAPTQSIMIVG